MCKCCFTREYVVWNDETDGILLIGFKLNILENFYSAINSKM